MNEPGPALPKPGYYILKCDGGIVAEQGQSAGLGAAGGVLKDPGYATVDTLSEVIGQVPDHHVAEYEALIRGLRLAKAHGIERLRVFLDSELVVNQIHGSYKVKKEHLKPLLVKATELIAEFPDIKISWVPREMNKEADHEADKALGR